MLLLGGAIYDVFLLLHSREILDDVLEVFPLVYLLLVQQQLKVVFVIKTEVLQRQE